MEKKITNPNIKTFTEFTPKGKKIKVTRFYYSTEDCWMCINCFHTGRKVILATIPCDNCQNGITQISMKYDKPKS